MRSTVSLLLLVAAVFTVMRLLPNPIQQWQWSQFTLPFRILKLQSQPTDTQLAIPVAGASVKQVADTWRAPRPGGRRHHGQDIFARRGTLVLAASDGFVTRIGENTLGGKTVYVTGRGGRTFYYAHLAEYKSELAIGDFVQQGSILGYVGTTGNAKTTPPHLHFAIYTPTGPVDPLPLLSDRVAAD